MYYRHNKTPAGVTCMLYSMLSCIYMSLACSCWCIHLQSRNKLQSHSSLLLLCNAVLHGMSLFQCHKMQQLCRHNRCCNNAAANFSDYFFECFCSSACNCCEKLSLMLVSSQSASQSSALAGSSSSCRHSVTRETCLFNENSELPNTAGLAPTFHVKFFKLIVIFHRLGWVLWLAGFSLVFPHRGAR